MLENDPAFKFGPYYDLSQRELPSDPGHQRLLYQQWTCLPWIDAGVPSRSTVLIHTRGTVTRGSAEPISTKHPERRFHPRTRIRESSLPTPDPIRIEREAAHLPAEAFPDPQSIHPSIRVLKRVRILLARERRWTKGGLAEDQFGNPVDPVYGNAIRWTIRGAMEREAYLLFGLHTPVGAIGVIQHALVRVARKQFPIDYRPATRAHRSALWPELIDLIHNARSFHHLRLMEWCEATLETLRTTRRYRATGKGR